MVFGHVLPTDRVQDKVSELWDALGLSGVRRMAALAGVPPLLGLVLVAAA